MIFGNISAKTFSGGESTTMNIFLRKDGFFDRLRDWIKSENGRTVWGTCAGMILLSNRVTHQKSGGQLTIGGIDITTDRNHFGRQRQSFEQELQLHNGMEISEKKILPWNFHQGTWHRVDRRS